MKHIIPKVTVLHKTPLLVAEYAGRTAYDSFDKSEHTCIRQHKLDNLEAESSDLLTSLAWVYHHHSVLEHINVSFLILNTNRGVLQEFVRHRIAAYTVKSTRYTLSPIGNAFVASLNAPNPYQWFHTQLMKLNLLTPLDMDYNSLEIKNIYLKLSHQLLKEDNFLKSLVIKDKQSLIMNTNFSADEVFNQLQTGKTKKNLGDSIKHIVTDNFKTDLVVTINLRSLKNFFTLRDSGAAYFLMQDLAKEMKKVLPDNYLNLIVK